ncbi:MAG: VanZ family protein [Ginsengibacter sp.]
MSKKFKIILSLIYSLFLGYAVFFLPRRRDRDYFHEINLTPVKYSVRFFNTLSSSNKLEVFNFYLNLFGNIILFIPVSFIAIGLFNLRSLVNVIFCALLLSIFIETTQYVFHIGFADVDDLILNVTGSIVGFYLYKIPNPLFG